MKMKGKVILGILLSLVMILTNTVSSFASEHNHHDIAFTAWNNTDSLPSEPGSYYLTVDVEIGSSWSVPAGTTNLCLDGHNISLNSYSGSVITVPAGSTLNLFECKEPSGKITGGRGSYPAVSYNFNVGGGVNVNGGTFVMNGGEISGNYSTNEGSGVFVDSEGSFTMNGGSVINNGNGPSVGLGCLGWDANSYPGHFIMNGGTVQGTGDAYGIDINKGTFTMTGGSTDSINFHRGASDSLGGNRLDLSGNVSIGKIGICKHSMITISGELTNSTRIRIINGWESEGGIFTDSSNTDYNDLSKFESGFVYDGKAYNIYKHSDGQLILEMRNDYNVTYKIVGGTWSDGSVTDKTETVPNGSAPASVPVGMKAAQGYTGGAWNTNPTGAAITCATTFTYTFTPKPAATIEKAPEAKTLTRNGQEQELVTGGEATGGEMQYAIGTDETTAPTSGWSASIPTAADTGTYYVWYKVVGDTDHVDSEAACVTAKINAPAQVPIIVIPPVVTPEPTATPDPTATPEPTPVSDITGTPDDPAGEPSGGPTEAPGDAEPTSAPSDDTATDTTEPSDPTSETTTDTPEPSDPSDGEDETPYRDVTIDEGFIRDITGTREATAESNPYETKIVNNSELKSLLRIADTEEDEGVNVWLDIQDISDTIPEEEKAQITEASTDGYTVALFLDASLFMKVGDNAPEKITETNGKIKVSIVIPEELRADGRSYEIIRLHDGAATVLQGVYDPEDYTFTFETDRFSAYAVAYKEQAGGTADSGEATDAETLPQTGLRPVDVFYGLGLAWICYGAIVCMRDIWRRREEKG